MSGRKDNLKQFNTIVAGDASGNLLSSVTNLQFLDDIGIQFTWSGSPVGLMSIEVSADYSQDDQGNVQNAGNWVPLTLTYWNGSIFVTATSIPTSVGSPVYVDLALLSAPWIRERYTSTSGSGTMTTTITAKQV